MTDKQSRVAAAKAVLEEEREAVRAELREAGEARKAAQAVLEEATAKLHALIYKALQERVIPVSTIHEFAGVAPSRVYQIQAEQRKKLAEGSK